MTAASRDIIVHHRYQILGKKALKHAFQNLEYFFKYLVIYKRPSNQDRLPTEVALHAPVPNSLTLDPSINLCHFDSTNNRHSASPPTCHTAALNFISILLIIQTQAGTWLPLDVSRVFPFMLACNCVCVPEVFRIVCLWSQRSSSRKSWLTV